MRDDDKTDLPGWLGLKRTPDFDKARWLGSALSVVVIVLFGMAVLVVFAVLGHALFGLGMNDVPRIGFGTGAVAVALIGAPFVIWRSVVAQKTVTLQEQGHITDRINTAILGLGEEKEVNRIGRPVTLKETDPDEPYMQAGPDGENRTVIEWQGTAFYIPDGMHVGNEGEWQVFTETQPNLEVRIGAIYALERIAQDSDRDHVQIMEILCAYIRQNAPAPETDDWPELKMYEGKEDGPLKADWEKRLQDFREKQHAAKAALRVREDIQVALTVIGRRDAEQRKIEAGPGRGKKSVFPFDMPCPEYDGPDEGHDPEALHDYLRALRSWKKNLLLYRNYRLDLRGADLCGADLSGFNLQGARLHRTYLMGADLKWARLQGADITQGLLQGADLRRAGLQGARLMEARLQGADLRHAQSQGAFGMKAWLQGADLRVARLQGADLTEARLQGADLTEARLQGADLGEARLQSAQLAVARLQGARLWKARSQRVNLGAAKLHATILGGTQLQGSDLTDAQFDPRTRLIRASLSSAAVKGVNFTHTPEISMHVQDMFGDASVILPEGCERPDHWPKVEMDLSEFLNKWRAWQRLTIGDRPPDPPGPDDPA